ncbi:uncharacterized protein TRIVIDRAFT_38123 [Trichoderma virens Gv29-8]|uniref:Uncharacterized protein n=1 Tax=Hypocrea virens (strain Gv29-8 / FGSC 10586) TaxID=413071 RepID=G9NCX3_HYPVG|nr:uncharacterized protein TRIVIDRAFT_38123 [Trichoderma virens Gv29-8]EHK15545.1 hypothetical protein TRIVIDRAFT_38123 [Trichoderma virens Gv29-8]
MSFTDEELDRNWQPNGRRPQSTIARNFQLELEDIFNLDETKAELQQSYDTRKYNINKNTEELTSLEARLREMEQRLNAALPADQKGSAASTPKQEASSLSAAPTDDSKSRSRPGTARPTQQAPSSGDMPPTPGASEGEYYVVTRADLMDDGPR